MTLGSITACQNPLSDRISLSLKFSLQYAVANREAWLAPNVAPAYPRLNPFDEPPFELLQRSASERVCFVCLSITVVRLNISCRNSIAQSAGSAFAAPLTYHTSPMARTPDATRIVSLPKVC